jgi:hypothetical protein
VNNFNMRRFLGTGLTLAGIAVVLAQSRLLRRRPV